MSQMTAYDNAAAAGADAGSVPPSPVSAGPSGNSITLRRTGGRPVRFSGIELCTAMSFGPGAPFWYELNIFRTSNQKFVVDVRHFTKRDGDKDRFTVFTVDTFDDAMHLLETYDAAVDIRVDLPVDDDSVPLAELGLHAASLRLRIGEARRQFRQLVGEILYELDRG